METELLRTTTVSFLAPVQDVFSALAVSLQLRISAGIAPDGGVQPVDHISEKIHAVERVPGLTDVIVAEDQSEVHTGPYHRCGSGRSGMRPTSIDTAVMRGELSAIDSRKPQPVDRHPTIARDSLRGLD